MSNEETIVMNSANQSKSNDNKTQQTQNVQTPKENQKSNNGKKVAATATAAGVGAAIGGAGAYAATTMYNDEQEVEAKVNEEPKPTTTTATTTETHTEAKTDEVPVSVDAEGNPDYTGQEGADVVAQDTNAHQTSDTGSDSNDVQVLGVYEHTTDEGIHQEMAVLTDGNEIAAVVDANGDREADSLWVDQNQNQQIDEGEVYDISDQHVQMSSLEQQYMAEQQQMEQQQGETYTAEDQQDYNNDADLQFA